MVNKKRVLVLGSSGLIGVPLVKLLKKKYDIYTTYHDKKYYDESIELDLQSDISIEKVFLLSKPGVVINLCGIYKNLDFCEKNKELVMSINGLSLKSIANFSNKFNSYLISISSDHVFDGKKGNYNEYDKVSPVNYYGKTRVEGEKNIQEISKKYCIIRTSMLWGKSLVRNTLSDLILDGVKRGQKLKLIKDQFMAPTYLKNFCEMLCEIVEKEYYGIIHLAGPRRMSRYDFAVVLLDVFGIKKDIIAVNHNEFKFSKNMPRDSSLSTDKATKLLNIGPEKVETSMKKYQKIIADNN